MSEDNTKDYLDESRPELKDNEILCDSCWGIGHRLDLNGWLTVNFAYLKQTWVCPLCQMKEKPRLDILQKAGL